MELMLRGAGEVTWAGGAPGLGEAALSKAARPAAVPAATAGAAGLDGLCARRARWQFRAAKETCPPYSRQDCHAFDRIHCGERAVVLGSNQGPRCASD